MAKRLNKNDVLRGRIFDSIAEIYGGSVLGFYEGKIRIEVIDEETGEIVQFSLSPTIHKTLVDEIECDRYVDTDTRIAEHQLSLAQKEKPKKGKGKSKSKVVAADTEIKVEEFNFEAPKEKELVKVSVEENDLLNSLMSDLGL